MFTIVNCIRLFLICQSEVKNQLRDYRNFFLKRKNYFDLGPTKQITLCSEIHTIVWIGIQETLKYAIRIIGHQLKQPINKVHHLVCVWVLPERNPKLYTETTLYINWNAGNQSGTGNSLILMSRAREAVINHTTCRWQLTFFPTGYLNWAGPSIPIQSQSTNELASMGNGRPIRLSEQTVISLKGKPQNHLFLHLYSPTRAVSPSYKEKQYLHILRWIDEKVDSTDNGHGSRNHQKLPKTHH